MRVFLMILYFSGNHIVVPDLPSPKECTELADKVLPNRDRMVHSLKCIEYSVAR